MSVSKIRCSGRKKYLPPYVCICIHEDKHVGWLRWVYRITVYIGINIFGDVRFAIAILSKQTLFMEATMIQFLRITLQIVTLQLMQCSKYIKKVQNLALWYFSLIFYGKCEGSKDERTPPTANECVGPTRSLWIYLLLLLSLGAQKYCSNGDKGENCDD